MRGLVGNSLFAIQSTQWGASKKLRCLIETGDTIVVTGVMIGDKEEAVVEAIVVGVEAAIVVAVEATETMVVRLPTSARLLAASVDGRRKCQRTCAKFSSSSS